MDGDSNQKVKQSLPLTDQKKGLPPSPEQPFEVKKDRKVFKVLIFIFISVFWIVVGAVGFWFFQGKTRKTIGDSKLSSESSPIHPSPSPMMQQEENFEVVLKENEEDKEKTDIYLKNKETGREEFYMALTNVFKDHYHSAEYWNGNLYILRRFGYDGYPDQEWSDELWKYNSNKEGMILYSGKGIDFRISPNEKYAAILTGQSEKLVFLNLETNSVQKEFPKKDLIKCYSPERCTPHLGLEEWSSNSDSFWVYTHEYTAHTSFTALRIGTWSVNRYGLPSDAFVRAEYDLNPNTSKIVLSDYPVFLEAGDQEQFKEKGTSVTLFIYDLISGNKHVIATSTVTPFNPKWIDNNTVEYSDQQGKIKTFKLD